MSGTPPPSGACWPASAMPTPASPKRRYRGAVIGAGASARQRHLPALRDAPPLRARVDVVAVVDSAADVAPVDGLPLLHTRDELGGVGALDFIDICTPTASHLDLTVWGLEHGYHALCQNPLPLPRAEPPRLPPPP